MKLHFHFLSDFAFDLATTENLIASSIRRLPLVSSAYRVELVRTSDSAPAPAPALATAAFQKRCHSDGVSRWHRYPNEKKAEKRLKKKACR